MRETNGNGWKSFVITIAGAVIAILLGIVAYAAKAAWEDMRGVHEQIIKEIANLKRCR